MGENIYYLVEVVIFTSIALVLIFKPEVILKNFKIDIKKRTGKIIGIIFAIVAIFNAFMNLSNFLK